MLRVYGHSVLTVALSIVVGVASSAAEPASGPTLVGPEEAPRPPIAPSPEGSESLFRGDLGAERGVGCSNDRGTAGGPNDVAVGVTATAIAPPFDVISTTYNIFSQVSPSITSMSFVGWAGGASPGAEFGRIPGLPFSEGTHSVSFVPGSFTVPTGQFFFGFNQAQNRVGLRWGQDTSGVHEGSAFIRAPACGAAVWTTVDTLGLQGNWVMAAVIDEAIPVELTGFEVE